MFFMMKFYSKLTKGSATCFENARDVSVPPAIVIYCSSLFIGKLLFFQPDWIKGMTRRTGIL